MPSRAPATIVVCTRRPSLLAEARRLALGVGAELREEPLAAWGSTAASLVLLGSDVEQGPDAPGVPRILIAMQGEDREALIWQRAADLGAEHVAILPGAEDWLTQRLIALIEPHEQSARTIGIVAGSGGAGGSVLACAAARGEAARGRRTLLIDGDALGGGLDLVLGLESVPGLRWPSLTGSRGRLRPSVLEEALPRDGDLAVLSWDRTQPGTLSDEVFDAVVAAGQGAFETVVIDLPRHAPPAWSRRCRHLVLVAAAQVRAVVAAAQVARRLTGIHPDVRLAVRHPSAGGMPAGTVAETLEIPLLAELRSDRALAGKIERGEGLPRRDRGVTRAAADLLEELL